MSGVALDADRLIRLGRVSAVVPSPDGTWVAVTVGRLADDGASYVSDLFRVPFDGAPVKLTRGDSNDSMPCFRRDGSLGFLSNRALPGKADSNDKERSQVWVLPAMGGEAFPVTDEPLGVSDFRFAAGGNRLVTLSPLLPDVPFEEMRKAAEDLRKKGPSSLHFQAMPVREWDHWIGRAAPHVVAFDEQGGERVDLTPGADREHREAEWDLSPDGRTVVVTCRRLGEDRIWDVPLLAIDTVTAEARELSHEPRTALSRPRISPDGARVACAREQRFHDRCVAVDLHVIDLRTGEARSIATDWNRWPRPEAWASEGHSLVASADDAGEVPLFRVDLEGGQVSRITSPASGGSHADTRLVPGTGTLVGIRSRFTHPPEPFRVALEENAEPTLLASLSGLTEEEVASIATVERIDVEADDGALVRTHLVKGVGTASPDPLVLFIHGGPISQWSDGWHWRWNPLVFVEGGLSVALPNPRGSTGNGQSFVAGIWGNSWGDRCFQDVVQVADALAARDDVDADRMAAMGGSFGGYMVNWLGGSTDRFRCLVTHAGLFDLSSFYGSTDFPAWFGLELGVTPFSPERPLDRYSPHTQVGRWKSPTLVVHGERDYRVPVTEALALFEALTLHGVDAELLVFPDENHWILKPNNIQVWYETTAAFLAQHLLAER